MTTVFAVETSCDDSALAIFSPAEGFLGEWVYRQTALHQPYGGVVPDLASREHMAWLPQLLEEALKVLAGRSLSSIAVTVGPGLAGSLGVGIAFAQALSLSLNVPVVPVNHLRGHALSAFIPFYEEQPGADFIERLRPYLPHLGLLVSGSNTLLFSLSTELEYHVIAQTVDDAAGEALDKGAKLLGMDYPGGPLIEAHAAKGNPRAYDFPRAFPQKSELKFSFSGLKTSLRYRLEAMDDDTLAQELPDLCASYQAAVVEAVIKKTSQVLSLREFKSLGLSGGVANNKSLRASLKGLSDAAGLRLFLAAPRHTGDNAGMIAFAAWLEEKRQSGIKQGLDAKRFYPSLPLV